MWFPSNVVRTAQKVLRPDGREEEKGKNPGLRRIAGSETIKPWPNFLGQGRRGGKDHHLAPFTRPSRGPREKEEKKESFDKMERIVVDAARTGKLDDVGGAAQGEKGWPQKPGLNVGVSPCRRLQLGKRGGGKEKKKKGKKRGISSRSPATGRGKKKTRPPALVLEQGKKKGATPS